MVRAFLSTEELDKLLKYPKGSFLHDVVLFAAMTGMRRGEIINLSWNDVDIERKVIMVRSSGSYQTKAGKIRIIPMNSTVLQLLAGRPHTSQYVFTGKRGDKLNGNFVRGRLKAADKGPRIRLSAAFSLFEAHVCKPLGSKRNIALPRSKAFRTLLTKSDRNLRTSWDLRIEQFSRKIGNCRVIRSSKSLYYQRQMVCNMK